MANQATEQFLFKNCSILDLDQGMLPDAQVRVKDGRIADVAVGTALPEQPGETVVDLHGRSIIPGLFQCHYHVTYDLADAKGPTFPVGLEAPPAQQAMRAVKHAGLALDAGFTSVISAGAPWAIDASLKAAIEEGSVRGPRMMAGSRDVSSTGHSQDLWAPWYWDISPPGLNLADGPAQFAHAVRAEIKRGAEIIKMFLTSGHVVRGTRGAMEVTREELSAAVQAAHDRDVLVRAHIAKRDAIHTALEVGVDVIDHGDGLDEECIELMLKNGAYLAPSMLYPHKQSTYRTPEIARQIKADLDEQLEILPVANKAGVKIVVGDDFGAVQMHHGNYAEEIEYYVKEAGIPALDVLGWATRNGAELMGMADELGVIKAGALADLVIVDGDPVEDISVLCQQEKILAVMKGGKLEKDNLQVLAPQAERAHVAA